jgi:hypothetical protein
MKKILVAVIASLTMVFGGGDVAPIETQVEDNGSMLAGFYVGAGLTGPQTYLDGEKDFFEDDADNEFAQGLGLIAGYTFWENADYSAAIEGRAARTFWNYVDIDDAYTYNFGLYVKPEAYFIDRTVGVYALAGYAKVGFDSDLSDGIDENGFSYGIGAEYFINEAVSVFGDYVMLPEIEDVVSDQFQVGVKYKF